MAEDKKLEGKKLTWKDLGIPQSMVDEIEAAGRAGVRLEDPPDYLVERTVDAVISAVNERREKEEVEKRAQQKLLVNERRLRSILWRFWYWLMGVPK